MIRRKLRELDADFLERRPDALGEDDEGDAPEHGTRIAPMAGAGALRGDQAPLFVEAQGRRGDAAPPSDLSDGQQVGRDETLPRSRLDFKLTLTCILRPRPVVRQEAAVSTAERTSEQRVSRIEQRVSRITAPRDALA